MTRRAPLLTGLLVCSALAPIVQAAPPTPLDWTLAVQPESSPTNGENARNTIRARPHTPFADEGGSWLTLGAGLASNFSDAEDAYTFVQWSTFPADNFELAVQAGLWALDTTNDTTVGASLATYFKWHYYRTDRVTLFAEAGLGVLLAGAQVPPEGTNVNFQPTLGAGLTWRLTDNGSRLVTGLRWHHISNARILGDDDNPARDGAMLYAGIAIPF